MFILKKKLPPSLVQKQQSERDATVTAVTDAIIELESQGYNTRIKDLIFVTGLSRSVFAKPHVRQVLVEYGVINPSDESPITANTTMRDAKMIIAEKNGYIQRLLFENEQLRDEIELLRGKIHLLTHKAALDNSDLF